MKEALIWRNRHLKQVWANPPLLGLKKLLIYIPIVVTTVNAKNNEFS